MVTSQTARTKDSSRKADVADKAPPPLHRTGLLNVVLTANGSLIGVYELCRAEKYRGMVCNLRNAENHYHSQN